MLTSKRYKVLIADDHQLFIQGLKLILKEELDIVEVDHALDGREAIEKVRRNNYDVVLLDVNMPVIDGVEAAAEIRRHSSTIKVLVVSMFSDMDTAGRILEAGADGFLIKNADASEFRQAFDAVFRDEIYLSPGVSDLFTRDRNGKIIVRSEFVQFTKSLVSKREKAILKMIAEGHTSHFIAEALHLSAKTVDTHRNNMLAKLGLPNSAALVRFAIENKLI